MTATQAATTIAVASTRKVTLSVMLQRSRIRATGSGRLRIKFVCKHFGRCRLSKTPPNKIAAILVASALTVPCWNASREVPIVHGV